MEGLALMFWDVGEYSQSVHSLDLVLESLWRTKHNRKINCYHNRDIFKISSVWLTDRYKHTKHVQVYSFSNKGKHIPKM